MNAGAVPYAIYAGDAGVWFTDRGPRKSIGKVSQSASLSVLEFSTLNDADPLEITWNQNELVFSEATGSSFGVFNPATSTIAEMPLQPIPGGLAQNGIAADADGNVYVAVGSNSASDGQGVYSFLSSQTDAVLTLSPGMYDPTAVIVDNAGNVWVAETKAGYVEKIVPKTNAIMTVSLSSQSNGTPRPISLAQGANGNIFVVDAGTGDIMQLGEWENQALNFLLKPSCAAEHITTGRYTDVWFTEPRCNAIARFDMTTGQLQEFKNADFPGGRPNHIAVDRNGNVWFTDAALHKIFEFVAR